MRSPYAGRTGSASNAPMAILIAGGLIVSRSVLFGGGVVLGAAPFVAYLASRGALKAFFDTSFVILPKIIDAVWSLPFPDLTSTFRSFLPTCAKPPWPTRAARLSSPAA